MEIRTNFCKGWPFSATVTCILKALRARRNWNDALLFLPHWQLTMHSHCRELLYDKGGLCVLACLSGHIQRCPLKFRFPDWKWYADNGLDKAKGVAGPLSPWFFLPFCSLKRSVLLKYVCKHPVILGSRHIFWAARGTVENESPLLALRIKREMLQDVRLLST